MKNRYFFHLLVVLLSLGLSARATTPPPATGRPLGEALNPDGTLRMGTNGSFDARQFRMGTAPDGRPMFRPAGTKGAGDERWQDGFGLPNGVGGELGGVVYAIAQRGTDVYVGGDFTIAGSVGANYVAKWNGTTWSSLGTGLANGPVGTTTAVYALAIAPNGDLYAGGNFTRAGGVAASNVAKWDGTAWSSLGTGNANGVSEVVYALATTPNGDLYAGGNFMVAGGIAASRVAKWDGTIWSNLGMSNPNGQSDPVLALAVAPNGDVYTGGRSQNYLVFLSFIRKWNGTAWSTLGTGNTYGIVDALAVAPNGDVYAGFYASQAGRVAKWNGTAWSSLGTGPANVMNGEVFALGLAPNGDVYVGGNFTQVGSMAASGFAKWNGTGWSSPGAGISSLSSWSSVVRALAVAPNGDFYVGGDFIQAGGTATPGGISANGIAKWNGTAWSNLGATNANGISGSVSTLAVAPNGDVYAGGFFTQAGGVGANNVAKWNGTTWSILGTGTSNGVNGNVWALALAPNGDVYVGGNFTRAGGVAASNVAKWNGTTWSSLGAGVSTNSYLVSGDIRALAVAPNGDVYVGGYFTHAGGVAASRIAKWNGTAWSSLGTGMTFLSNDDYTNVRALAIAANGDVYAGGYFAQAGGVAVGGVAKWNGTVWSSLGTVGAAYGIYDYVEALALAPNGDVYVGGSLTQAGGCVAKWNGTAWSSVGNGLSNGVSTPQLNGVAALALDSNGDVYVVGRFSQASRALFNGIAKWDGTAWSGLGTGIGRYSVSAIVIGPAGKLIVGGVFAKTGDGSKVMAHFGIYDPNAPLATAAAQAAPAGQLFPNPAHGTAKLRLPVTAPRLALTLTDALGRVVRRYPAPATAEAELDLRGLPAGTYVVRCGAFSQRLVVE